MTDTPSPEVLLDAAGLRAAVESLAKAIHASRDDRPMALVGLLSRGDLIARRVAALLEERGQKAHLGHLDISLYRDDLGHGANPTLRSSHLPFSVDDARIILVDDVLFTGRTIRSALNAVMDYGRPAKVELAVLVDRGGREMPIQPDYTGYSSCRPGEKIAVFLTESDGEDKITLA